MEEDRVVQLAGRLRVLVLLMMLCVPGSVAAEEPSDGEQWELRWKNGLRFERRDGAFEFGVGGRIQIDFASISQQPSLTAFFDGLSVDPKKGTGVRFRRARIYVRGTLYEHLVFKAEYDFADSDSNGQPDFADVYVGLKGLPVVGTVLVGHVKEPFSLEYLTSSRFTTFLERALVSTLAPRRNTGILVINNALDDRLVWEIGGFRNTGSGGSGFSEQAAYDVTARVAGQPWYTDGGRRLVHLGFAYSHQFRDDERGLRYAQVPESSLAQAFVDTSNFDSNVVIPARHVDLFGLELAGVCGPLSLQGEAIYSRASRSGGMEPVHFWGAYGQVSYFLTGEHRRYSQRGAVFTRTSPKANLDWQEGHWGAWEVALRGSHLDLDSRDVAGGRLTDLTTGLNWYPYPNARLMTNFVWAQRANVGDAYIYEIRFQVDF